MGLRYAQAMAMLDVAIWLMAALLVTLLVCVFFALFAGLLSALTTIMTKIFLYSGIDLWEYLENRCHRTNRPYLLALASIVAKAQTPLNEKNAQFDYLTRRKDLGTQASAWIQRDVYLAEQVEALEQKNDKRKPSPTEQLTLEQYRQESQEISMKLHENWQELKSLSLEIPVGAWIRADLRQPPPTVSNRHDESLACRARNGCCAYNCGCCGKIRVSNETQKERPAIYLYSHCTTECGCCLRRERRVFGQDH